jgi:hypothetical protein
VVLVATKSTLDRSEMNARDWVVGLLVVVIDQVLLCSVGVV